MDRKIGKNFHTFFAKNLNFNPTLCVINPVTPKGSPFEEQNRLALDRVKFIKSLLGLKGLRNIKCNLLHYMTAGVLLFQFYGARSH